MTELSIISHATGALFFGILSLVLLTGGRGMARKNALIFASLISTAWLGLATISIYKDVSELSYVLEPLRSFSWLLFLGFILLASVTDAGMARKYFRNARLVMASFTVLLTTMVVFRIVAGPGGASIMDVDLLYGGFLLLSVIGLVLVEQIMRNAHVESRRAVKYLCIGMGVVFAYDFYLYSNALLFRNLDAVIWEVRGFVNAMVVPVLGVAIARDPQLSLHIFGWFSTLRRCWDRESTCWRWGWVATTSARLAVSGVRLSRPYSCLAPRSYSWCCFSPAGCAPACVC
jgi:hypothetical protein